MLSPPQRTCRPQGHPKPSTRSRNLIAGSIIPLVRRSRRRRKDHRLGRSCPSPFPQRLGWFRPRRSACAVCIVSIERTAAMMWSTFAIISTVSPCTRSPAVLVCFRRLHGPYISSASSHSSNSSIGVSAAAERRWPPARGEQLGTSDGTKFTHDVTGQGMTVGVQGVEPF